jgi:menaquinone-dependent protoporphyrinogen oxidase
MTDVRISRRRFLLAAGGVAGAAALACAGLTGAGTPQAKIDLVETTYGGANTMNGKILVTYASRTGSTAGVAEKIGKALAESGAQVDVRPMTSVTDLSPYRAVVAGSAIQGGQWLPEARQFMLTHQAALARQPFAAFLVCMTLAMPGADKYREHVATWLEPVRAVVKPVSEGLFAGALDIAKIPSVGDRLKFRLSVVFGVWAEGDHRDGNAIRAWAESLRPRLLQSGS